jgi:Flp pilus assembly pilin Flp
LFLQVLANSQFHFPQSLNNERKIMFHHSLQRSRGQATTEYALILLVAAIIALLVIAWATAGGGAGKIGSLFDTVFNDIFDRASNSAP